MQSSDEGRPESSCGRTASTSTAGGTIGELFAVIGLILGTHKLTPAVREHLEPVLIAAVGGGRLLHDAGRLCVSRA